MRTSQGRPGADLCPTGQRRCESGNAEFGLFDLALAHFTGGYPRNPDIDSRPAPGRGASHIPSTTGGALLPLAVQQISTSLGADSSIVTRSSRTIIRARSRSRSVCRCAPAIFNVELKPILSAPSTPPLSSARPPAHRHVYRCHRCQSVRSSTGVGLRNHHRRPTWAADFCQRGLDAYTHLRSNADSAERPDNLEGTGDLTQRFLPGAGRHALVDSTCRGCREALDCRLVRVPAMSYAHHLRLDRRRSGTAAAPAVWTGHTRRQIVLSENAIRGIFGRQRSDL